MQEPNNGTKRCVGHSQNTTLYHCFLCFWFCAFLCGVSHTRFLYSKIRTENIVPVDIIIEPILLLWNIMHFTTLVFSNVRLVPISTFGLLHSWADWRFVSSTTSNSWRSMGRSWRLSRARLLQVIATIVLFHESESLFQPNQTTVRN